MPKPKLTPEQYRDLKNFLDFFADRFMGSYKLPPEKRPGAVLDAMEKTAPARAAEGLMMAINDCIEMSSGWDAEKVASLDAELKSSGIITLNELRRQYSRQYARVIKRGHIKSEEEYYLLKGVLDGGSLEMSADEKKQVVLMLDSYENAITGRKS